MMKLRITETQEAGSNAERRTSDGEWGEDGFESVDQIPVLELVVVNGIDMLELHRVV